MTDITRLVVFSACAAIGCGDNTDSCGEPGIACTWLGVPGEVGFTRDGGDRLDTIVYWTMDTLFASDGTAWFLDWNNHVVRRVSKDGKVTSVVGWTDPVFPGDGNLEAPTAELSPEGSPGSAVQLNHPTDLAELPDGRILLMSWHNHKLRTIDPDTGHVRILAGAGPGYKDGAAVTSLFKQPSRLVVDDLQNIYILDQQNQRVRKCDANTLEVTSVVGSGTRGFAGDGGPATSAQLNLEVGDNPEPAGGMAYTRGTLYISDTDNNRIRRVDLASGVITTIAGTGDAGFGGDDGPATAALLNHPRDLEIGPEGDLYVADTDNGRVRAIELASGTIRTVAGTATMGLGLEQLPATATQLSRPFGIDFDRDGNLYISDTINSRILRVTR